jgi:hypothetical protein
MNFEKVVDAIGGKILEPGARGGREVKHVVASDLMSDVLLVDEEGILLLTSLASDQVLRTAQIVGAVGVILVNGKSLPSDMSEVARGLGMALATTVLPKYEACLAVSKALQRPA